MTDRHSQLLQSVKPAGRIRADGTLSDMESPTEQGIYAKCIGLKASDNPYPRLEKLNHRLWLKGFNETSSEKPKQTPTPVGGV